MPRRSTYYATTTSGYRVDQTRTGVTDPDAHLKHLVNHVAIILDGSSSVSNLAPAIKRVVRELVARLAAESKAMQQETRVSLYGFADGTAVMVWDADVLRLPDIDALYAPYGNTALLDATAQALDDFGTISQKYGNHGFLAYVITDGEENVSRRFGAGSNSKAVEMRTFLAGQPENVTVAILVPNQEGVSAALGYGFHQGNIQKWDAQTEQGVEAAGVMIGAATSNYFTARSKGATRSSTVFSTGVDAVNAQTVAQANLTPVHDSQYVWLDVEPERHGEAIEAFVIRKGLRFVRGKGFYALTKREEIQAQKNVMVVEKATGTVYSGPDARSILGLPDMSVKVSPDLNPLYGIYVQSTSNNRKLVGGTRLLYMTR